MGDLSLTRAFHALTNRMRVAGPVRPKRTRPPFARTRLFETLEKRFLLTAELAVIPPTDPAVQAAVTAPVQADAGFDLAATAETKLQQPIFDAQAIVAAPESGQAAAETTPSAPQIDATLFHSGRLDVLDLSQLTDSLTVTLAAGGGATVDDGAQENQAYDITAVDGGTGDDTYRFSNNWGERVILESAVGGTDTLDFSGVTTDLTVIVHVDGRFMKRICRANWLSS